MFQVVPEKVLISTGAWKNQRPEKDYDPTIFGFQSREERLAQQQRSQPKEAASQVAEEPAADEEPVLEEDIDEDDLEAESAAIEDSDPAKAIKKQILGLRTRTKTLLNNPPKKLSGGLKQDIRAFSKSLKSTLSRAASTEASTMDELEADFSALSVRADDTPAPGATKNTQIQTSSKRSRGSERIPNPRDDTKPYHTPWRPRDFMAAFAFIPRYLEVNQNICSAVYLRHPVAKPGLAEVPTPFHPETGQLTFNWYLRRR
jgi:hypothetical protein